MYDPQKIKTADRRVLVEDWTDITFTHADLNRLCEWMNRIASTDDERVTGVVTLDELHLMFELLRPDDPLYEIFRVTLAQARTGQVDLIKIILYKL